MGAVPTARICPATLKPSGPGIARSSEDEIGVLVAEALDGREAVVAR